MTQENFGAIVEVQVTGVEKLRTYVDALTSVANVTPQAARSIKTALDDLSAGTISAEEALKRIASSGLPAFGNAFRKAQDQFTQFNTGAATEQLDLFSASLGRITYGAGPTERKIKDLGSAFLQETGAILGLISAQQQAIQANREQATSLERLAAAEKQAREAATQRRLESTQPRLPNPQAAQGQTSLFSTPINPGVQGTLPLFNTPSPEQTRLQTERLGLQRQLAELEQQEVRRLQELNALNSQQLGPSRAGFDAEQTRLQTERLGLQRQLAELNRQQVVAAQRALEAETTRQRELEAQLRVAPPTRPRGQLSLFNTFDPQGAQGSLFPVPTRGTTPLQQSQATLAALNAYLASLQNATRVQEELARAQREAARRAADPYGYNYRRDAAPFGPGGPAGQPPDQGGGGGFIGNFGRGFRQGRGPEPLSYQAGQVLRTSLLYGVAYRLLSEISQTLSTSLDEAIQFQTGLTELAIATDTSRDAQRDLANTLGEVATSFGDSSGAGVRAGTQALGVFRALDAPPAQQQAVAQGAAEVVERLKFITGQQTDDLSANIAAIVQAFGVGAEQIGRVTDTAAFFEKQFGVAAGSLQASLPAIASLGRQGGFSLEELSGLAAAVQSRQAGTPAATSGLLSQILSRQGQGATSEIFQQLNITAGTFRDKLVQLAQILPSLSGVEQQRVGAAFGRGRSQSAAIAALEELPRVIELAEQARGGAATGLAQRQAELRLGDIGGQIRILVGQFKEFSKELGEAGLLDVIGALALTFGFLLSSTTNLLEVWNEVPRVVKDAIIAIGLLTLASKAGAGGLIAGRFLNQVAARGGTVAYVGGGVRATAAASGLGARGLAGSGAAALGLTNPLLLATAGLIAIGAVKGVQDKYNAAMQKAVNAIELIGETSPNDIEALKAASASAKAAAEDVRKNARGSFLGIDFKGGSADAAAKRLDNLSDNLGKAAAAVSVTRQDTTLGPFGDFSPTEVKSGFDQMNLSGRTAAEVLNLYTQAIDENGKVTKAALDSLFDPATVSQGLGTLIPAIIQKAFNDNPIDLRGGPLESPSRSGLGKLFGSLGQQELRPRDQKVGGPLLKDVTKNLLPSAEQLQATLLNFFQENGITNSDEFVQNARQASEAVFASIPPEKLTGLTPETFNQIKKLFISSLSQRILDTYSIQVNSAQGTTSTDALALVQATLSQADRAIGDLSAVDLNSINQILEKTVTDIQSKIANVQASDIGQIGELLKLLNTETGKLVKNNIDRANRVFESLVGAGELDGDLLAEGQKVLNTQVQIAAKNGDAETLVALLTNASDATFALAESAIRQSAEVQKAALDSSAKMNELREDLSREDPEHGGIKTDSATFAPLRGLGPAFDEINRQEQEKLQALRQARINSLTAAQRNASRAQSSVDRTNPIAQARVAVDKTTADYNVYLATNPGKEDQGFFDAVDRKNDAAFQLAQLLATPLKSIRGAQTGSQLVKAQEALTEAQTLLDAAGNDAHKQAEAMAGVAEAQNGLFDAYRDYNSNLKLLSIDTTNPLLVAQKETQDAADKLAVRTARFAPGGIDQGEQDVLTSLQLDLKTKQTNEESVAFSQNLSAIQTAEELGQKTHDEYISYLEAERSRLESIGTRTEQQTQQLRQVSLLLAQDQPIKDTRGARIGGGLATAASALADATAIRSRALSQRQINDAGIALFQAQNQYAEALREFASNSNLLDIDITNPLLVAEEEVRKLTQKLQEDTARLAEGGFSNEETDLLNSEKLDLRRSQVNQESTAFSQRLQDIQTAENLGRISHSAYLSYLQNEHDRLEAVGNRTRQQQEQLDQVDGLLKEAQKTLEGQFNLGDIRLPTPYQVRRYIAERTQVPVAVGPQTSAEVGSNVTIYVDGADTGKVIQVLNQYLGTGSSNNYTIATR